MFDRAKYMREYRQNIKKERYAHRLVQVALEFGKLFKGTCRVCNCDSSIEAHHWDYSKPYDVWWLCKKHHGMVHRVIKLIQQYEPLTLQQLEGYIDAFINAGKLEDAWLQYRHDKRL